MTGSEIDREQLREAIDRRLGLPFKWLSRGPGSYYCLGLWLDLLEELTAVRLADPFVTRSRSGLIDFWRYFTTVSVDREIRPLDLLHWKYGDGRSHIATVESDRWAVSVSEGTGVHRLPFPIAFNRSERVYRFLGLEVGCE